jgi:orotidine-5'-phosphate decarboxylase
MTPREARTAGADLVVVGRPLRNAKNPAAAAREIVKELAEPS